MRDMGGSRGLSLVLLARSNLDDKMMTVRVVQKGTRNAHRDLNGDKILLGRHLVWMRWVLNVEYR